MTPESFTPEEVAALKKLARQQIVFDKSVADLMTANPKCDEKTAKEIAAMINSHEE